MKNPNPDFAMRARSDALCASLACQGLILREPSASGQGLIPREPIAPAVRDACHGGVTLSGANSHGSLQNTDNEVAQALHANPRGRMESAIEPIAVDYSNTSPFSIVAIEKQGDAGQLCPSPFQ